MPAPAVATSRPRTHEPLNSDLTHLLLAVVLLLLGVHGFGWLAARLPNRASPARSWPGCCSARPCSGLVARECSRPSSGRHSDPGRAGHLLPARAAAADVLLGAELRSILSRRDGKATAGIAALGNAVPFLAGLGFLKLYDTDRFLGPAGNRTAFVLVFALAMAVTSIPVISRIMTDLGIMGTRFARIVLSVAVLEDLLVYVVLNLALAMVVPPHADTFSLPELLGLQPASALGNAYYVAVTLAFFALAAVLSTGSMQRLAGVRGNLLHRSSPLAFQLVLLLALTTLAAFLGISPIFGALVAGMLAGDLRGEDEQARQTVHRFAFGFFIPLYFAIVGIRLDLVHHFEPVFFVVFLSFACLTKATSCYAGARLAGQGRTRRLEPGGGAERPRRARHRARLGGAGRLASSTRASIPAW